MIRDAVILARPRISLMVGAASVFGAFLAGGGAPAAVVCAAGGAILSCAGCSALNQVQERDIDSRMRRTAQRPVAAGRMTPKAALLLAGSFLACGLTLFALAGGWRLLALGVAVVIVYNGLYTPLKRVSPLALLVGALAGAAPPLTGWLASGAPLWDQRALTQLGAVLGVFYLWQIPHFWLLAEKYHADYERAGIPVPAATLPRGAYGPLMAVWVLAYFIGVAWVAALAAPAGASPATAVGILLAGAVTAGLAWRGGRRTALRAVNASMGASMAGLAVLLLAGGA